jgi:FixJ family two-component response regulator
VQDFRSVSIADDDALFRVALITFMRAFEFKANGFGSVEEFETAPEYLSAACVVTYIRLPLQSGIDLKRHPGRTRSDVPVITITAPSESALLAIARSNGAKYQLQKPFAGDVPVRCIEGAPDGRLVPD